MIRGLLVKTGVLLALAIGAGYAHSTVTKVMLRLPEQNTGKAGAPGPEHAQPVTPAPQGEAPAAKADETPAATTPPAPVSEPVTPGVAEAAPVDDGWNITVARAREIFDTNQAIFIDARTYAEFKEGHILGAMHIDKKYFDGATPKKVLNYLPGSMVVVYCAGGDCTDSEAVAKRLIALNLQIGPIYILKDGLPGWTSAGHPVAVGAEAGFN